MTKEALTEQGECPRVVLTTRSAIYFAAEGMTMVLGHMNAQRLIRVEDDAGNRMWLNPAAVSTVREEPTCS